MGESVSLIENMFENFTGLIKRHLFLSLSGFSIYPQKGLDMTCGIVSTLQFRSSNENSVLWGETEF
jgi:hypothetical protein